MLSDALPVITAISVRIELFKRRCFDFIVDTPKGRHLKQEDALNILTDDETEELLYGGAAGGGKSWIACCWLLFMCLIYPGTRWFIGRAELKRLTESTLVTFFKVASEYGCDTFKFNGQKNYIRFSNGSQIDLLDLAYKPSDPMYERFGSTEYTGGMIEEGGEVNFTAFDVLKTRIGRHLNEKYGLIGKIFITCNPKKNWLYTTFYLPAKKGLLEIYQKYLSALVQDNPAIDSGYIERLRKIKDKATKARLLGGDWEYDDDPTAMISYQNIIAIYANTHVKKTGVKYLVADVARYGSDKARICVFDGWVLIEHHMFAISSTVEIQGCILAMLSKHKIPKHNAIADDDGVGGGVVDNCEIIGFVNNSKPIRLRDSIENPNKHQKTELEPNYFNLQTQCAYLLADQINEHQFYIECHLNENDKQDINTELSWLKTYKADDDRKQRILPKEIIKENIGGSPDWRDVFLMRKYFDIRKVKKERGVLD